MRREGPWLDSSLSSTHGEKVVKLRKKRLTGKPPGLGDWLLFAIYNYRKVGVMNSKDESYKSKILYLFK